MKIKQKNKGKKTFLKLFLLTKILLVLYLAWLIVFVPQLQIVLAETDTEINYIQGAHRGASLDYRENTLEAFEAAIKNDKYQFIEFDITYTKDHKIAVIHQNNNYRIPKYGKIAEMTYQELQEASEMHIPTYQETMELIAGKKPLDIEIKTHGDVETGIELTNYIIEDAKQRGIIDQILITSPTEKIIQYVESKYPKIPTGRVYFITAYSLLPLESTTEEFYNDSEADYILLHGYNLENIVNLTELKPEDKTLMIWYFTDEVYILGDEGESRKFWE